MEDELLYKLKFEDEEPLDDYWNCNTKVLKIEGLFNTPVLVSQNVHIGKGGILWDASYIMAKMLLNQELFPEI